MENEKGATLHVRGNMLVDLTQRQAYFAENRFEVTTTLPCACGHISVLRTDVTKREFEGLDSYLPIYEVLQDGLAQLHEIHVTQEEARSQ